ncbi:bis(5'-nucleosyl)-tetraphosphatase (symmetrical) YqeK, partial [Streptococcus pyogenes]
MNYRDYLDFSREELLEKVASSMSEKRFRHVLGVEQAALELAELYGYD